MKLQFCFVTLLVMCALFVQLPAQALSRVITKPLPCRKDFEKLAFESFFMEYRRLATVETKPEGGIILFIHFNEAGKLKGAEYIIAGESKEVLVGMSEKFLQLIQGFKCEEAVEYPSTIVIPIAILPDPYFEYYQDPELKSEKTIYQLDPGLAQLLYDLRRSEAFYVWDIYRFPMRYRKAED